MKWQHPLFLIPTLFIVVLLLNSAIIAFDVMYPEQPTMYLANQTIHHWSDLANIYFHPHLFQASIPFFRPTGHFLMYQLLTPLLGWHNTKALIVINLFFLSLTGFFLIRLYPLLFPQLKIGGAIAFAFYLMHPALMLPRLIILHFDYAYTCFLVWSLYCFAKFCASEHQQKTVLLGWSLILFAIATTFKEPAIMLGPVLFLYYGLSLYSSSSQWRDIFFNARHIKIFTLIFLTTIVLGLYLTLPWPGYTHPLPHHITSADIYNAFIKYLVILFGLKQSVISEFSLRFCDMIYPLSAQLCTWFLLILFGLSSVSLIRHSNSLHRQYVISLLFLILSAILFALLPIRYALGHPWHLSPTLIFYCLMLGFGADYLLAQLTRHPSTARVMGYMMAMLIAFTTLAVNSANINHLSHGMEAYKYAVNRNAVFNPPDIKANLNSESVIIVEDSLIHDDYWLGNSSYPYYLLLKYDYQGVVKLQYWNQIKFQPLYNGTLFKWAYLIPDLREEVYPFQVDAMHTIPNEIIYDWSSHATNIFCLGYDRNAHWHDKTQLFKQNLLAEKEKRHILVNAYQTLPNTAMQGNVLASFNIGYPDKQICAYKCDQNTSCKGFTFAYAEDYQHKVIKCFLYKDVSRLNNKPCSACTGYIKQTLS